MWQAAYAFSLGSTGDPPVPSGDSPDGIASNTKRGGAVSWQQNITRIPPGGSPGGTGESPVPPSLTSVVSLK